MEKTLRLTIIIFGILFVNYSFGQTDIIKMYNNATTANEPAIKKNAKIIVSNLANFENGDFVCYEYNDKNFDKQIKVHRLLGKSGDIVEIKNGVLYLNNKNIDENLELKHLYLISSSEYQNLLNKENINMEEVYHNDDKVYIILSDKIAKKNGLSSKINLKPKQEPDETIAKTYGENWNTDNFGPIKIPIGKCFVIGDNRHNSEDSRYNGLINESDIFGTVILK